MRTQAEILQRVMERASHDTFNFEVPLYLAALSFQNLESLRGHVIREDANLAHHDMLYKSDEDVLEACRKYMPFAWEKANGERGISAYRSLMHYKAWLWLLGEYRFDHIEEYENYAKDHLVDICRYLGISGMMAFVPIGMRSNRS